MKSFTEVKLPFLLPDFTRVIWHNADARALWSDRIHKASNAWAQIEREAVVQGMRDSCLAFYDPAKLPEACAWAAVRGLTILPLTTSGLTDQYSATPTSLVAGKPWQYRAVLTRPALAEKWILAWTGNGTGTKNRLIGELLGYPSCCQDFFENVWVAAGGVDTTWQMAVGTTHPDVHQRAWDTGQEIKIPVGLPPESNIMLRWLGIRLVPHLPCSFQCTETAVRGKQYADVGRQLKLEQEVDWIYDMLEWPIEWSARIGIGEVRTPVCTISTRTDATALKLVVQREGTKYPAEGASGLRFPFRVVTGKVTEKPAYQRAQVPEWELNGFGSEEYMKRCHDVLLSTLPADAGTILDLGAGTGRFLERARDERGWQVSGLEFDAVRAGAARMPMRRGDLFYPTSWQGQYDVIAFMPGRLNECPPDRAAAVLAALKERAGALLVYAYGDWLTKFGGLKQLVEATKMSDWTIDVDTWQRADGVEAALARLTPTTEGAHAITATVGHGTD